MDRRYALIVDDNPDSREILRVALAQFGFDAELVGDGKAALESVGKRIPDIILLDLMMPRMNGFQVLRHLRESATTRDVPVIVISSVSNQSMKELPNVAGVIEKPSFSVKKLKAAVEEALKTETPPSE